MRLGLNLVGNDDPSAVDWFWRVKRKWEVRHGGVLALWQVQADGTLTLATSVTYDIWGRPTLRP